MRWVRGSGWTNGARMFHWKYFFFSLFLQLKTYGSCMIPLVWYCWDIKVSLSNHHEYVVHREELQLLHGHVLLDEGVRDRPKPAFKLRTPITGWTIEMSDSFCHLEN